MINIFKVLVSDTCVTFGLLNKNGFQCYEVNQYKNEIPKLLEYIKSDKQCLVGYNINDYDYQILHYVIEHQTICSSSDGSIVIYKIKQRVNELMEKIDIVYKRIIYTVDLIKVFRFDKEGRFASIYDLGVALNYSDISYKEKLSESCEQQCKIINRLYKASLGKSDNPIYKNNNVLKIRQEIHKETGLNCMNSNDIMIGYNILTMILCNELNCDKQDLIDKKDFYSYSLKPFSTNDAIPKFFKTKDFEDIKSKYEKMTVDLYHFPNFSYSKIYHGVKLTYGFGGLHGMSKNGIYKNVYEFDINSIYPMIECSLGIYPRQFDKSFLDIFKKYIIEPKLKEQRKENPIASRMLLYKKASNSTYGKSNEKESYLYDPAVTLKTTIGCQLLVSQWMELMYNTDNNIKFIYINTDAIAFISDEYNKIKKVTDDFLSSIGLEYKVHKYVKLGFKDVNDYIALDDKNNIISKGIYSIDKEFCQNNSMKVVRDAVVNNILFDINMSDYIKGCKNYYDFFLKVKLKKSTIAVYKTPYIEEKLKEKVVRYIITKDGGGLRVEGLKTFKMVESCNVSIANVVGDSYNIDYNYYIGKANALKLMIEDNQQNLFE